MTGFTVSDTQFQVGKVNGHTTNFTVINLREGKHHYFAVKAATKNGKSVAADTTSPVVPKKVISKYWIGVINF